ncbi:DUF2142 domain-containing protein [Protaetiibacter intestinalis]|uniref:DUF2142 domain-containing protein n=1 Tax=Protaetiibacter intestinalis TaxID=2419774 RepID=A0A387B7N3_9MICO|nr:DUF2142 domain-containing protein [Protaetiibacter intestinalis]AYF98353.1 DUF2142 domain-containing protein [Protaetiibacter intestinalis]
MPEFRSTAARSRVPAILRALIMPAALLIALGSWALASPPGASPDEDYHLTSIWCGLGERPGLCEEGDAPTERRVPLPLLESAGCFAFDSEKSASCTLSPMDELVNTNRGNFAGGYPPLFYGLFAVFASQSLDASVIAMRLVNAAIFVALTTALYLLLPRGRRAPLLWAAAISSIPLGIFLIPSLNPSSWSVLSAMTLWVAYAEYLRESRRGHRIAFASLAVLAAVMGSGARADSAVYAVLGVGAASILLFENSRRFWMSSLLGVGICVVAVSFFLSVGQSAIVAPDTSTGDASLITLIFGNLLLLPQLWSGVFGTWGLGWLDTTMPGVVWVTTLIIYGAGLFVGIGRPDLRKAITVIAAFAALVVVPMYILVHDGVMVGTAVQPRYVLPLIILLAGVALWRSRDDLGLSGAQMGIVVGGLSIANAVALHTNIRRYVTGDDVGGVDLDGQAEWWWKVGFGPTWVWVVGSIALATFLIMVARSSHAVVAPAPVER